jgi:hypothetical protein
MPSCTARGIAAKRHLIALTDFDDDSGLVEMILALDSERIEQAAGETSGDALTAQ